MRLHVAQDNSAAVKFYSRQGFQLLSQEKNSLGTLLLMEKKLTGGRQNV